MVWEQIIGSMVGIIVLGAVFVPIERFRPLVKQKLFRKQWRTDVTHLLFTGLLDSVFAIIGIVAAFLLVGWWAPPAIGAALSSQPMALQMLEAFLLGNFLGYWSHRLSHTIPLLWRFHKIHHSSRKLDWLAAARRHPLEQTWVGLFIGIPLIFLGFNVEQVAIVQLFNLFWGIFLHSNTALRFKGLRHVIATPEFHHWHHSANRYNTNYSLFPWLDRMFGTSHQPPERAIRFGVDDYDPPGYVGQMIEPFRRRRTGTEGPPAQQE